MDAALISRINKFGKDLVSLISILYKFVGKKKHKPTLASLLNSKRNLLEKSISISWYWKKWITKLCEEQEP